MYYRLNVPISEGGGIVRVAVDRALWDDSCWCGKKRRKPGATPRGYHTLVCSMLTKNRAGYAPVTRRGTWSRVFGVAWNYYYLFYVFLGHTWLPISTRIQRFLTRTCPRICCRRKLVGGKNTTEYCFGNYWGNVKRP